MKIQNWKTLLALTLVIGTGSLHQQIASAGLLTLGDKAIEAGEAAVKATEATRVAEEASQAAKASETLKTVNAAKAAQGMSSKDIADLRKMMGEFKESQATGCVNQELAEGARATSSLVAHDPSALEDLMKRIRGNATFTDKDTAFEVVKRLKADKITDAVDRNTVFSVIKESSAYYAREGLGKLDPQKLADMINTWDRSAVEGFEEILADANRRLSVGEPITQEEAVKRSLRAAGRTEEEAQQGAKCATAMVLAKATAGIVAGR